MASTKFLVILVIASFLFFNPCNAASALVESVCRRASDYQFCISTFVSDPRSESANLQGLGLLSIQITLLKVQNTREKFSDLRVNITDPVGSQRLNVCESDYGTAVEKFGEAFSSMNNKAYSDVINWVRDGTNAVIDCQDIYRRSEPIGESPVSADNLNVVNLSGVILTVDSFLIVDSLLMGT